VDVVNSRAELAHLAIPGGPVELVRLSPDGPVARNSDRDRLALASQMVAISGILMDSGRTRWRAVDWARRDRVASRRGYLGQTPNHLARVGESVQRVVFDAAAAPLNVGSASVGTMVSNSRWRPSLRCSVCRTGVDCGAFLVPGGPTGGPKWSHHADPETSGEDLPWPVLAGQGLCRGFLPAVSLKAASNF